MPKLPKISVTKKRTKRPKCIKSTSFPCGNSCQPQYRGGKEVVCGKAVSGQPKTFLEWGKQTAEKLELTNKKRALAGLTPARIDGSGYIVAERTKAEPKEGSFGSRMMDDSTKFIEKFKAQREKEVNALIADLNAKASDERLSQEGRNQVKKIKVGFDSKLLQINDELDELKDELNNASTKKDYLDTLAKYEKKAKDGFDKLINHTINEADDALKMAKDGLGNLDKARKSIRDATDEAIAKNPLLGVPDPLADEAQARIDAREKAKEESDRQSKELTDGIISGKVEPIATTDIGKAAKKAIKSAILKLETEDLNRLDDTIKKESDLDPGLVKELNLIRNEVGKTEWKEAAEIVREARRLSFALWENQWGLVGSDSSGQKSEDSKKYSTFKQKAKDFAQKRQKEYDLIAKGQKPDSVIPMDVAFDTLQDAESRYEQSISMSRGKETASNRHWKRILTQAKSNYERAKKHEEGQGDRPGALLAGYQDYGKQTWIDQYIEDVGAYNLLGEARRYLYKGKKLDRQSQPTATTKGNTRDIVISLGKSERPHPAGDDGDTIGMEYRIREATDDDYSKLEESLRPWDKYLLESRRTETLGGKQSSEDWQVAGFGKTKIDAMQGAAKDGNFRKIKSDDPDVKAAIANADREKDQAIQSTRDAKRLADMDDARKSIGMGMGALEQYEKMLKSPNADTAKLKKRIKEVQSKINQQLGVFPELKAEFDGSKSTTATTKGTEIDKAIDKVRGEESIEDLALERASDEELRDRDNYLIDNPNADRRFGESNYIQEERAKRRKQAGISEVQRLKDGVKAKDKQTVYRTKDIAIKTLADIGYKQNGDVFSMPGQPNARIEDLDDARSLREGFRARILLDEFKPEVENLLTETAKLAKMDRRVLRDTYLETVEKYTEEIANKMLAVSLKSVQPRPEAKAVTEGGSKASSSKPTKPRSPSKPKPIRDAEKTVKEAQKRLDQAKTRAIADRRNPDNDISVARAEVALGEAQEALKELTSDKPKSDSNSTQFSKAEIDKMEPTQIRDLWVKVQSDARKSLPRGKSTTFGIASRVNGVNKKQDFKGTQYGNNYVLARQLDDKGWGVYDKNSGLTYSTTTNQEDGKLLIGLFLKHVGDISNEDFSRDQKIRDKVSSIVKTINGRYAIKDLLSEIENFSEPRSPFSKITRDPRLAKMRKISRQYRSHR